MLDGLKMSLVKVSALFRRALFQQVDILEKSGVTIMQFLYFKA